MRFVSFDPLLTMGIPDVTVLKPEYFMDNLELCRQAECLLFPAYWHLPVILGALEVPFFPSLNNYLLGHSKAEMTRAFQAAFPDHMPYTVIARNTESERERVLDEFVFPFVCKDLRSARGCGVYLIDSREDFEKYAEVADSLYVQEYLPIDRDMRIVWIGDTVRAAYYRKARAGEFHNNVAQGGQVIFDPVPAEAVELVARAARKLKINFAGFDVAQVGDHFYFFEFNNRFGTQALNAAGERLAPLILEAVTHGA